MEFEWDENKNELNKEKHGIDFNDAKEIFKDKNRISSEDKKKDYGEKRWITIGIAANAFLTVVYTIRDAVRIISARRANRKEREKYNTILEGAVVVLKNSGENDLSVVAMYSYPYPKKLDSIINLWIFKLLQKLFNKIRTLSVWLK